LKTPTLFQRAIGGKALGVTCLGPTYTAQAS